MSNYIPMSRFASQFLNEHGLCSLLASDDKPLNFFCHRNDVPQNAFLCDKLFFHWLKLKICGTESNKFSFG